MDSFSKITEVAHIDGPLFSTIKVTYALILTKKGLGYILGDFLTNSSGHPGASSLNTIEAADSDVREVPLDNRFETVVC
jgi:hypothetical protein